MRWGPRIRSASLRFASLMLWKCGILGELLQEARSDRLAQELGQPVPPATLHPIRRGFLPWLLIGFMLGSQSFLPRLFVGLIPVFGYQSIWLPFSLVLSFCLFLHPINIASSFLDTSSHRSHTSVVYFQMLIKMHFPRKLFSTFTTANPSESPFLSKNNGCLKLSEF